MIRNPLLRLAVLLSFLSAVCLPAFSIQVIPGDVRTDVYLPLLTGKRVALYANHTAEVNGRHLLDLLIEQGVEVVAVFAPEHGFRGTADAGEHVSGSVDKKTGVPVLSLYDGRNRKPSAQSMRKFDVLLMDIQDVGLRFYTYYITMYRLMDACAEYGREFILLDRPNPNGHYVDGPLLDMKHKSGVGALPIPVVHGMTLGELARMVNGEGWLTGGRSCRLTVVPCLNYTHSTLWTLPIAPSPNLPDMRSVYLYPSLCLFEGTPVSLGRGTDKPFQVYGHPDMKGCSFTFTPRSRAGARKPPLQNRLCHGVDLSTLPMDSLQRMGLTLRYLIDAYHRMGKPKNFFRPFFTLLIGVDYVERMVKEGKEAEEIEACWKEDVKRFKEKRKPYLLYK